MADTIVKSNPDAPALFFEAEAAGLRWLADAGGARIVRVIDVGAGRIELERVHTVPATPDAARTFGAALAVTHGAGAASFGAGPGGWYGPLFIGRRPLPVADESSWGVFYAKDRVLPYLELAIEAGGIGLGQASIVRQACDEIAAGVFDDDESPARIHGDLWNGNVLWSQDGVVLIDPAAHGGHRETDLAMLALFGCPYLDEVMAGYSGVRPLRAGWHERIPLHQLHPLAVHAASYGRGYGDALADAAARVIALADAS
ncbi:fructosamine kinase family protein [Humibacter sp. RRB41]|uniref:fructosamine kinase family protein n=1 Tax=Humibacter sp. RRB41 TaxID=2919946 RepID=UPI001FAB3083|nr:fructosamine kinase family protein [Humibacter sp. RRB41]